MRRAVVIVLIALAAPGVARAAALSVTAGVQPPTVHFGDPFRYAVEAHGSGSGNLRVIADPGVFEVIGAPSTTRSNGVVRVTETLICLGRGCVPNDGARAVALPPPKAFLDGQSASGSPVTVTVVPRVASAAVKRARYVEQTDIPPVTARLGPAAAGAIAAASKSLPRAGRARGSSSLCGSCASRPAVPSTTAAEPPTSRPARPKGRSPMRPRASPGDRRSPAWPKSRPSPMTWSARHDEDDRAR